MPFWHEQGSGMDRLTAMEVFVRIIDTVLEAEANLGIAITPDWFVLREIEDGRLKAILTEIRATAVGVQRGLPVRPACIGKGAGILRVPARRVPGNPHSAHPLAAGRARWPSPAAAARNFFWPDAGRGHFQESDWQGHYSNLTL